MKTWSLEQIKDKYIGELGTKRRKNYEKKLKLELDKKHSQN